MGQKLSTLYAVGLMAGGVFASLWATDWLYDGKSYVVWWIVFLFLWPLVGGAIWGLGMIPVAIMAAIAKER